MNKFNLREWVGKGKKNLLREQQQGPGIPTVQDITFNLITDIFVKPHIHNSPTIGNRPFTIKLELEARNSKKLFNSIVEDMGESSYFDSLTVNDIMDRDDRYISKVQEISAIFWQKLIAEQYDSEYSIPYEALDFKIIPGDSPAIKDLSAEQIADRFGVPLEMLKQYNIDAEFLSGDQQTVEDGSDFHDFLHDMILGVARFNSAKRLQFSNLLLSLEESSKGRQMSKSEADQSKEKISEYVDEITNELNHPKYRDEPSVVEPIKLNEYILDVWNRIRDDFNIVHLEDESIVPYDPAYEGGEATYHVIVPYLIPVEFHDSNGRPLASKLQVVEGDFNCKGFDLYFDSYSGLKLNFDKSNLSGEEEEFIYSILSQEGEKIKKAPEVQDSDFDDSGRDSISKALRPDDDDNIESDTDKNDSDTGEVDSEGGIFSKFNLDSILDLFT